MNLIEIIEPTVPATDNTYAIPTQSVLYALKQSAGGIFQLLIVLNTQDESIRLEYENETERNEAYDMIVKELKKA